MTCSWIVWNRSLSPSNHPRPSSRSYCHCYLFRAFEASDISKEPTSKTSRFWMFGYISGVVIGLALSKGSRSGPEAFRAGHFDSKPETAHEKHLAPRVFLQVFEIKILTLWEWWVRCNGYSRIGIGTGTGLHLITQGEFCSLIDNRWEVSRKWYRDQLRSTTVKVQFKASCSGKMLQFWDLWAKIHREKNLLNEFQLWGKFLSFYDVS